MQNAIPHRRGIALVIVLAFLVLMSAFILGFFTSVTTELKYSKTAANTATANQLADSAVNLVMSQIVEGTRGVDPDKPSDKLAWASQPGMIHTFDAKGTPKKIFKLYSSDQMASKNATVDSKVEVPNDWSSASNAGLFTDLNNPVLVDDPNGPIQPDKSLPAKYSAVYPIFDPLAEDTSGTGATGVDGFKLTSRPGYVGGDAMPSESYDPTVKASADKTGNAAPMPVKWLYVLKDGSIKRASLSSGAVSVEDAKATNPIVGRIAFWADDETAKVNINTASEGVYWDIPRIFSQEDSGNNGVILPGQVVSVPGLALCQPANGEFQRYPGHPATTCLSTVFGKLLPLPYRLVSPVPSKDNGYAALPIGITTASQLGVYYNIAPRIPNPDSTGYTGSTGGLKVPSTPLVPDADRLYASIDELMFQPLLDPASGKRKVNTSTNATPKLINKSTLERARFFITANSSAPEVTLFNTPRVGIWPVNDDVAKRSAFDKLAAFCSTANGRAYFFTRKNPRSGSDDYDGIAGNQFVYKYLQALTSSEIPGFGGSFSKKYPVASGVSERDQILTNIFDYIRCVNLSDKSVTAGKKAIPYVTAPSFPVDPATTIGGGEVIPIRINNTQGFGRFATVTEFDLVFYKPNQGAMRAVVLMQFGTPMQGNIGYQSGLKYRTVGLGNLKVKATGAPASISLQLKDGANFIECSDLHTMHGRGLGGIEGPGIAFMDRKWVDASSGKHMTISGSSVKKNYPFFSSADVPMTAATFDLDGGEVVVEVVNAEKEYVVQTLHFQIPPTVGVKTPLYAAGSADFNARIDAAARHEFPAYVKNEDTVLGLQLAGIAGNAAAPADDNTAGDMRLAANKIDVKSTFYRPHQDWTRTMSVANGKAYGLMAALGNLYTNATSGSLVAAVTSIPSESGATAYMSSYGFDRQPGIPSRVRGMPATTGGVRRADGGRGDWDTGTGTQKDGAYINKADEGDQQFKEQVSFSASRIPYVQKDDHMANDGTTFSPTRQIPSALMFGSIPSGVARSDSAPKYPWQTLLFHPRPEDPTHPGRVSPPDHLLADLFWMPVVEPYAISQPFSTSGKININYQIQPFTYIQRSTGLQAVMKSTRFMALKATDAANYKPHLGGGGAIPAFSAANRRYSIDMANTLVDFQKKFDKGEVFKSATELCEMNFIPAKGVPAVTTSANMAAFWNANTLTGDNLREKPYADIYPRLTTKSNTFTVHVCVQTLKKTPNTPTDIFVDPDSSASGPKDIVLSEYRGSTIIERYIDPNDPNLPDFASLFASDPSNSKLNIDQYYKFRVVSTKRFAP